MRKFEIELLDVPRFAKVNELKEITNPIFFIRDNMPTPDGLLSNEIFGITKSARSGTFAYVDLSQYFLHPLYYKIWAKLDKKVKEVVHGTDTFIINSKGEFESSPEGKNGIKFIMDNIDKINIKATDSTSRDRNIKFLQTNKKKAFINKMVVIPAFFRDINTEKGYVGVGEINKLYDNVIISVRALKESKEYGLNLSAANKGRIQELLLQVYNWFGSGTTIGGMPTSGNLPSKQGIIRRSGLRKTTDYGSRLILSAPNLLAERLTDIQVDMDHCLLPMASACVNFYPFVLHYVRRYFEEEFTNNSKYEIINKQGEVEEIEVHDYQIAFSDERIKKELDRFIHGYSNRFIPIEVPNRENRRIYMIFKGRNITADEFNKEFDKDSLERIGVKGINRPLTWCDIFYRAAYEVTRDKMVLITRYPIDSMYNQFPSKVNISSTVLTESMVLNGQHYTHYPKIRLEDILTDTSNKFIDTLVLHNAYLQGIGGDYDGDQATVKGVYSDEANLELEHQMNSKINYINFGGSNVRVLGNEAIQSIYSLTLVLSDTKLVNPSF